MRDYSQKNKDLIAIDYVAIAVENIKVFFLDPTWKINTFVALAATLIFFTHIKNVEYVGVLAFAVLFSLWTYRFYAIPRDKWHTFYRQIGIEFVIVIVVGTISFNL